MGNRRAGMRAGFVLYIQPHMLYARSQPHVIRLRVCRAKTQKINAQRLTFSK